MSQDKQYPVNDPRHQRRRRTPPDDHLAEQADLELEGDPLGHDDREFEEDEDQDSEEDELDDALDNCGQLRGGGCSLIGTEYCDWECPFHKSAFQARDARGRFT